ncbi:MAG: iron-sulfur cluster assembly accessory protein [Myxococcaceae bacterium]|nr:iron-sulfur cluster assembly accessory protein [Myxococcaceae bacterium]
MTIQLTEKAIEVAKAALLETTSEEGEYLRISVHGGGCAGFKYGLSFSADTDENDLVMDYDGLKVVTDVFTATQISGTVIDYEETLSGSGFRFNNPTAKRTCGCGSSFG